MGYFSEFRVFFPGKQGEIINLKIDDFCESSFFQGKHPEFSKRLCFANRLANRPLVGFPGEKRHININFLLWLTSRWPWDKQLVVPRLTAPKS